MTSFGFKHSEKTKDKMSLAHLGVKRNPHSEETKKRMSESQLTTNPTYIAIHIWLHRRFGSADHCENLKCEGKSKTFEWSLLKGKEYERKRESFWQLCKKCHHSYDENAKKMWITRRKEIII